MATLQSRLASLISAIGADMKARPLISATYTSAPAAPQWVRNLNYTIVTTQQNLSEVYNNSFLCGYINEWGALRGQNPYTTFADALVRAIIPATGIKYSGAGGNFIEMVDRRITAGAGQILYGRRWSDGRLMRKDTLVTETYTWNYGDADPTNGGTIALPAGVQWVLVFTAAAGTQALPSWAPSGSITVRPS